MFCTKYFNKESKWNSKVKRSCLVGFIHAYNTDFN